MVQDAIRDLKLIEAAGTEGLEPVLALLESALEQKGDQGCSVLENTGIIKHFIKVHTVFKKFKADIFNIILAQDVEGKTSQFGKDMGIVRIRDLSSPMLTSRT